MSAQLTVPVALMFDNRPAPTRRVFEVIRRARPATLYLIADGPRDAADAMLCEDAREIARMVDWDCDVHRNFADSNLGLRVRPSSGLDWVFSEVEKAIVLEDDCLPDPSFFDFCSALLARYEDDDRVMEIGGCNYLFGRKRHESYYFSKYTHIWGWASWRRAWNHYDVTMAQWPAMRDSGAFEPYWASRAERRFWTRAFNAVHDGRVNTWDYQWTFAMWCARALSIVPPVNLVSNIGFGVDATNTKDMSPIAAMPTEALGTLRHPETIQRDDASDRIEWMTAFYEPPSQRAMRWLRRRAGLMLPRAQGNGT